MQTTIKHLALLTGLLAVCGAVSASDAVCTSSEKVIWACNAGQQRFAVCASADLSSSTGYMQYRVMKGANLEFAYPSGPRHPRSLFLLSLLPRGASLTFRNGEYQYAIYEPLIGPATIDVARTERPLATITCASATDGLTLTTTQELLSQVGVYNASGARERSGG
jgi:hypothetical protein